MVQFPIGIHQQSTTGENRRDMAGKASPLTGDLSTVRHSSHRKPVGDPSHRAGSWPIHRRLNAPCSGQRAPGWGTQPSNGDRSHGSFGLSFVGVSRTPAVDLVDIPHGPV